MNFNMVSQTIQSAKFGFQKNFGFLGASCLSSPLSCIESCGQIQSNVLVEGVRFKHSKKVRNRVQKLQPGGIRYHGFTYFPRFPNQVDPPVEPSKLFMVKRVLSLYGCPYWDGCTN